jgi:hypothetical protein
MVEIGEAAAFFAPPRRLGDRHNTLPLPVVGGVVAAILYGLAAAFRRPQQESAS